MLQQAGKLPADMLSNLLALVGLEPAQFEALHEKLQQF
jgi:hypothetical protein